MDFDIKKKTNFKRINVQKSTQNTPTNKSAADVKPSYASTVYTPEDQEKLLIGYELVPRESWLHIPSGVSIRYMLNDGKFRRGGYVHNILQPKSTHPGTIFVETNKSSSAPGYHKWPIVIDNIKYIWKQRTHDDIIVDNKIGSVNNDIDSLQQQINAMREDNKKLMNLFRINWDKLMEVTAQVQELSQKSSRRT